MPDVLAITGPIFLLIGLGYAALHWRWIDGAALPAIGAFVLRFALPALLFKAMVAQPFAGLVDARFLVAYAGGSLAVFGAGLAWVRLGRGGRIDAAAITAMGMSCSNSAFIGFPVVMQVVGPPGAPAVAMALLIENIVMLPLTIALAESASLRHQPFARAFAGSLAGLWRNPLVLAILAGLACALAGWKPPPIAARAIDLLAGASLPTALFYIGGTLVGRSVGALAPQAGTIALGKLVAHPLAVFAALLLAGPVTPELALAAVLIACAPVQGILPILGQRFGQQGVAAAALLICTTASFFTLAAAIWVLQTSAVFAAVR